MYNKRDKKIPQIISGVLLNIVSFSIYADTLYKTATCEFSASFPIKTEETITYYPNVGEIKILAAFNEKLGYFLRAECAPKALNQLNSKSDYYKIGNEYIDYNGIEKAQMSLIHNKGWPQLDIKGYKKLDKDIVTYRIVINFGKSSILTQYAGGFSNSYPQDDLLKFINSITKK